MLHASLSLLEPFAFLALGALGSLLLWVAYGLPKIRAGFEAARVEIPELAKAEVLNAVKTAIERAMHDADSDEAALLANFTKVGIAHGLDGLAAIAEEHPEVLQHPLIAKIEERMEKRIYAAWGNIVKGIKKKAGEGIAGEGEGDMGDMIGGLKGITGALGIDIGPLGDMLGMVQGLSGMAQGMGGGNGAPASGVVDLRRT